MGKILLDCFGSEELRVESEIINPFTMIYTEVIDNVDKFSKNEFLAYAALCRCADNKSKECFPSYKTIAKFMRTSVTLAQQAIRGLLEKGVIKYKQRLATNKEKEKLNELDSNVYVLVDIQEWEQTMITNAKVLALRDKMYKSKNEKIKESIKSNKKVASAGNTNNLNEVVTNTSNNSYINNSIAQKEVIIQDENTKKCKKEVKNSCENTKTILENGISIPKSTSKELLEEVSKWDKQLLEECIEYMKSKKHTIGNFNINYLVAIYMNPSFKNVNAASRVSRNDNMPFAGHSSNYGKTKFHNFDETFTKYTPEELEEMINKSQKDKFK